VAAPDFYSVAPDCIQHGLPPGNPYSAENLAPFQDCANGYFTFGPGTTYWGATGVFPEGDYALGDVVQSASGTIYFLTAIGFAVSIAAFVGWVWFEHIKLAHRAAFLRAAGRYTAKTEAPGTTAAPGTTE